MSHRSRCLLVAAVVFGAGVRAHAQASLVERFQKTEQALMDAIAAGDKAVWDAVLDPEFAMTGDEGELLDRKQLLEELRGLPPGLTGILTVKDLTVQDFGAFAVVRYLADEQQTIFGQKIAVAYRVTNTYRRQDVDWKMVASQITVVTQDPPAQEVSTAGWAGFVGKYRVAPDGWTFTVERRDGRLWGGRDPQRMKPLIAIGPNVFVLSGSLGEWIFVAENGKASRIVNVRKFAPLIWTRVEP